MTRILPISTGKIELLYNQAFKAYNNLNFSFFEKSI